MKFNYREQVYRSAQAVTLLEGAQVTVCGAGALGANLCESLARCGVGSLRVIDRDRVEEHNLSTQPYLRDDVGSRKAEALSHSLYRAVGVEVEAVAKELVAGNVARLLKGSSLVVDCFDNSPARRLVTEHCRDEMIPCLHAGLATGYSEVIWNDHYRVPSPTQDDICDYPLARNLVTLTVGVCAEAVIRYLVERRQENWTVTLGDLTIRQLPE